jgi:putative acetyltransferase
MFKIRECKNTDYLQLVEMISTVLAEFEMSLDFEGPDKDLQDLQNVYFDNNGAFFIAQLDSKIIGSVAVSKIDDEKCELRKLYVLKEHRSQGFGQILLDKAIDFALSNGYKKMELEVSKKHKQAIELYEKTGFVRSQKVSCCPRCDFIYIKDLI